MLGQVLLERLCEQIMTTADWPTCQIEPSSPGGPGTVAAVAEFVPSNRQSNSRCHDGSDARRSNQCLHCVPSFEHRGAELRRADHRMDGPWDIWDETTTAGA